MSKLHEAINKVTGKEKDFIRALLDKEHVEQVYADWLSEQDREAEAALMRAKAGLSKVYYDLRHKPTGCTWGKLYQKLGDLRNRITRQSDVESIPFFGKKEFFVPLKECEVIIVECVQNIHPIPLPWNAINVATYYGSSISLISRDDNPILLK